MKYYNNWFIFIPRYPFNKLTPYLIFRKKYGPIIISSKTTPCNPYPVLIKKSLITKFCQIYHPVFNAER